jgi:uncharacterized protein (TIGR01319 family)
LAVQSGKDRIITVDVLSAEIGSTTTVVSAFDGFGGRGGTPRFLGQGAAPTTVTPPEADVRIGLEAAISDLAARLGVEQIRWKRFSASSSAAGGLRMSVHGLVYDMTVKAAREAALGAGANIIQVSAGRLRRRELEKTIDLQPNIIMIAGGLDYGERDTALDNAEAIHKEITRRHLAIPVLYAGNIENQEDIRDIFRDSPSPLYLCENVYPKIDQLNIEPARKIIQDVFEEHITHAPGMEHIRELVNGHIMPVPGAVMNSARLLADELGDLAVIDVGGATTDVHSVCDDSPEIQRILIAPEPRAKRTVEGDLGLYVNRLSVLEAVGAGELARTLAASGADPIGEPRIASAVQKLLPIPADEDQRRLALALAFHAARLALSRHAGRMRDLYSVAGRESLAEGKDLSGVGRIIGTGGALTRLPGGEALLRSVLESRRGAELFPVSETPVLLDRDYIMATMGVLADEFPREALSLLMESLGVHQSSKENRDDS